MVHVVHFHCIVIGCTHLSGLFKGQTQLFVGYLEQKHKVTFVTSRGHVSAAIWNFAISLKRFNYGWAEVSIYQISYPILWHICQGINLD